MGVWRLLPFRKADAVENMAVDEAVFRANIRNKALPTLRFYGWRTPALSIGYFQDFAKEVDIEACRRLGIDMIRRPTGGKAVLHDQELTYAVIAGTDSPLFPPGIINTFRIIGCCIAKGLMEVGIRLLEGVLTQEEEELKSELMTKKYGSENWTKEGCKSWISGL